MFNSDLPSDIFSDIETFSETHLEEFGPLKQDVVDSPNNIDKWDKLLAAFDTKLELKSFNQEFKSLVSQTYTELLTRFPYLVNYWKKWSIVEYKLNGEEKSKEVVSKSVNNCQFSIDLWVDYLSVVELESKSEGEGEEVNKLGDALKLAIELNGNHFNSDKIWDKYLEYLKSTNQDLLPIYLELIEIPLYEYSKYFNQFMEINKTFKVEQIIPEHKLPKYLSKYVKSEDQSVGDLSQLEQNQIIDEYSYDVFTTTQEKVNSKWNWESKITMPYLDLKHVNSEQDIWIEYLDHELQSKNHKQITNLFERSLIPNCFNETIWLKYLAYLNQTDLANKFQIMDSIYTRSINKFLPLDMNFIRFNYPQFLVRYEKPSQMTDYLFDLLKYFSGDNYLKKCLKAQFLETIDNVLLNWNSVYNSVLDFVKLVIENFFDNKVKVISDIDTTYQNLFMKYVNDQSIIVITQFYLTHVDEDVARKFFNKFHTQTQFKSSLTFWKFFMDLEAKHLNFINLDLIINHITHHTTLSKIIIDSFLDTYFDLCRNNYKQFKLQCGDRNLIDIYPLFSTSVVQNPGLLNRYGKTMNSWKKNYESPGLRMDSKPELVNRLSMGEFSLLNNRVPELPILRNIESNDLKHVRETKGTY